MSRDLEMDVLYDGACATCRREVERLRSRPQKHVTRFVDARDIGLDEMVSRVHETAIRGAAGGVQAVHPAEAGSGYGWLVAVTRVPGLSHGLVLGYRLLEGGRRLLRLARASEPILN